MNLIGLRIRKVSVGSGNQPQVRNRRFESELAEIFFAVRNEVRQAFARRRNAETRVQVCAFKIRVDGDDALTDLRHGRRQVRRNEGLTDPSLATRNGKQSRILGPFGITCPRLFVDPFRRSTPPVSLGAPNRSLPLDGHVQGGGLSVVGNEEGPPFMVANLR